ncbi:MULTISPECIES: LysR family transcriptional regulator [Citrobacter]|uniref:LysR family transcriptional regulator n=1 Tax=Citrobacter TaxID=544 RepID=UPI0006DA7DF8|nr:MULTISPECIES: LysR family transcriptional regulator [Citrobacter]OCO62204.1 LysR family transcriptional regulator [Citrobacter freundii]KAA1139826.1 LysR family transcriptional regulator [Citrobacter portucalensis]MDE9708463.1 LysR family transcriptional regulator [Citrobacter portucalensis]MDM2818868.1 LysR family transcriptional regulator [Citrobacter sp. Cpo102]MDM2853201.1 LysR family transcriptional regulator [Citrobacter sp. Cpo065]
MDHLLAIRTFQRIVETRSFTKAAAHLGLPRSTVSKLLKELEEHLGIKLIHRTTRSVTLTIEGAEYYQRISRLVAKLDETEIAMRDMGSAAKGRLRIDLHSSLANFVLIPILEEFRERYPHIQLALGVGDRPVNLIEEGVDCVIRAGELADSSLVGRTLYKDRLVTCASPDYLERFGIPKNVSDLENGHKVVGYFSAATGEAWPLRFRNRSGEKQVLNFDIAANDSASLINLLVHGMGIGQTHVSVAKHFIQSGQLVPILEDLTNTQFPVSIIYPPTKQLNARLRIFIDWMLERLSGYH